MKTSRKVLLGMIVLILAGIYYYVALPAINIHSSDVWFFVLFLLAVLAVAYAVRKRLGRTELKQSRVMKIFGILILIIGVVYLAGTLLSSPIINAKKYQSLLKVEEREFTKDILIRILLKFSATEKWEAWWTWYHSLRQIISTVRSTTRTDR